MSKPIPMDVIGLLSDGQFHSGEEIGALLGVSRAAVWKKLQSLEAFGLQVESVKGKGYRLLHALSLFNESLIEQALLEVGLPKPLIFSQLDSTNAELLKQLESVGNGQVLMAEQQLAGRGRRGRQWQSPFGANLYYSMAWSFEGGATRLQGLSLVVGMALQSVLTEQGFDDVSIKWPNDIWLSGKKLAGILLEIAGDPTGLCHVVIGIGVNVNMLESGGKIDQAWTSLQKSSGKLEDKSALSIALTQKLAEYIAAFDRGGFELFREAWSQVDALQGTQILIHQADAVTVADYQGVNSQGELLALVNGVEKVFNGGEVSVRKAYLNDEG